MESYFNDSFGHRNGRTYYLRCALISTAISVTVLTSSCDMPTSKMSAQASSETNDNLIVLPNMAHPIDQETNLYQVDDQLFRSEQLEPADVSLLLANDISAIINLRFFGQNGDEKLLEELKSTAKLSLYNQPLKAWNVDPSEVAQALRQIQQLQAQNKRVLVHCYHGADRTGLIIAMYRIIHHGWTIEQAKHEMTDGGFGYHPIWLNLENMLNPSTVEAVRLQLAALQNSVGKKPNNTLSP